MALYELDQPYVNYLAQEVIPQMRHVVASHYDLPLEDIPEIVLTRQTEPQTAAEYQRAFQVSPQGVTRKIFITSTELGTEAHRYVEAAGDSVQRLAQEHAVTIEEMTGRLVQGAIFQTVIAALANTVNTTCSYEERFELLLQSEKALGLL